MEPDKYAISEDMEARLANSFTYHAPHGDQAERYGIIREAGKTFARLICHLSPPSREQSLAITAVEEAVMRANQAIALNETPGD